MRKECVFPLEFSAGRPLIALEHFHNLLALIDTGASIPVWAAEEGLLTEFFHPRLVRENVAYSGFGGATEGNLYRIDFKLGDICYPDLPIVTGRGFELAPFDMIISATMLEGFLYQIDTVKKNMLIQGEDTLFQEKRIIIDNKVLFNK